MTDPTKDLAASDAMRAEFHRFVQESKAFPRGALLRDDDGGYADAYTMFAWIGFQAGVKDARGNPYSWSEWRGGAIPVEKGTPIVVRHRSGKEMLATAGYESASEWGHFDDSADIVAYRLI